MLRAMTRAWFVLIVAVGCGGDDDGFLPIGDAGPPRPRDGGPGGPVDTGPLPDGCVAQIGGRVVEAGDPTRGIAGARVTLESADGATVLEARTDASGGFALGGAAAGTWRLGASARDRAYLERSVEIGASCLVEELALGPETEGGRWDVVADPRETFGGTNSGVLLPDGRVMFCHDTLDPVIYDPTTDSVELPPSSPRLQGCHAVSLLPDGRLYYVGGTDYPVYGPGTRQAKTFDPATNRWEVQPDLVGDRWYPSMAPLPNGSFVVAGGGGLMNPTRVRTSETLDPATMTWSAAGDLSIGNEVSPVLLLYTGEVLMTHRPPQLFNPSARTWRAAADFVQGDRMPDGDHADHELALLPDGRAVAVGYKSYVSGTIGNLVEIYDPVADEWTLGANFAPVRSRANTVMLPDERLLTVGGYKQDDADPTPTNEWGYMALADLYDTRRNAWRRLTPMNLAREYHAVPILIPDGRVIILGGEGQPGNDPPRSTAEAFTPPYLMRGPRPEMRELSSTALRRGETFTFRIARTTAPTGVVLMGTQASTHFMESGNARFLELDFTQSGDLVTVTVPSDPARAIRGWYLLFTMVDDIPSRGTILRVE